MEFDSVLFVLGALKVPHSNSCTKMSSLSNSGLSAISICFGRHFISFIFNFWKIVSILSLSKDIAGTNGRTLTKYSRLCKKIFCTESVEGKNGAHLLAQKYCNG